MNGEVSAPPIIANSRFGGILGLTFKSEFHFMKNSTLLWMLLIVGAVWAIRQWGQSNSSLPPEPSAIPEVASRLIGEWAGEEGAFANISRTGESWTLVDENGPHQAHLVGDHLEFPAGMGYTATAFWDEERSAMVLVVAQFETVYHEAIH